MWKILAGEFWADLKTQKTRALLTLFAIAWGTIAVVLMLSFGEGLKRSVVEGEFGQGGDMLIIYGGETSKPFEGLPRGRDITLREEDLALLTRAIPEIERSSASYGRWGTQLKAGPVSETTFMEGVSPDFGELRNMAPAPGGRFLLYTGSAIVAGRDGVREALAALAEARGLGLVYEEIDPDVFGGMLRQDAYRDVERIAAVGAVLTAPAAS